MITLRDRLIAFWAENPDVALTRAEVSRKYGVIYSGVVKALASLEADGLIVQSRVAPTGLANRTVAVSPSTDFHDRLA